MTWKAWGHSGAADNMIIMKGDWGNATVALLEGLGKPHGGIVIPESLPRGESQATACFEEAGQTVRVYAKDVERKMFPDSGSF